MAGVGVTISGQDSRDRLSEKITVNTDLSEMREQATQTCVERCVQMEGTARLMALGQE